MSDQIIVAIIGAVSAVVGALIQAQSLSQTAQPKSTRFRQIFFGALVGLIFGVVVGLVAASTINSQKPRMSEMEIGIDRLGNDYKRLPLTITVTPEICKNSCAKDSQCQAWTYVKQGEQDPNNPLCYLKHSVPKKIQNQCCISGVKQ